MNKGMEEREERERERETNLNPTDASEPMS